MLEPIIDPPDLDAVVRALRDLGDDFDREIPKALTRVASKLEADARAEVGRRLPRGGGLAARVARAKLSTRRRGGRTPGVSITATGMAQLAGIDAGTVTHPVFGNRDVWVVQEITGGWFSEPTTDGKGEAAAAIEDVLDDTARDIARRLDSGL